MKINRLASGAAALCAFGLSLLGITPAKAQTLIANYPLTANSNDATGNYGAITYGPNASQAPSACSNGASGSTISTPSFASRFNTSNFAVSLGFTVNSYAISAGQPRPVFVIDNSYRGFGVSVGQTGLIGVMYNNSYYTYSTTTLTLGQSYTLLVRYAAPNFILTLNGTNILSGNIGPLTFSPQASDIALHTYNASNGQTANGCINNLKIFANGIVLPVELTSFTATADKTGRVGLQWNTASERGSERFEIERSADGNRWEHIGTVAAAGNSSLPLAYKFEDGSPLPTADAYYRLRQVDRSGSSSLSAVQKITGTADAGAVAVYPNPATDAIRLANFSGSEVELYELGRATRIRVPVAAGTADLRGLVPGMYVIRLISATGVRNIPFRKL